MAFQRQWQGNDTDHVHGLLWAQVTNDQHGEDDVCQSGAVSDVTAAGARRLTRLSAFTVFIIIFCKGITTGHSTFEWSEILVLGQVSFKLWKICNVVSRVIVNMLRWCDTRGISPVTLQRLPWIVLSVNTVSSIKYFCFTDQKWSACWNNNISEQWHSYLKLPVKVQLSPC